MLKNRPSYPIEITPENNDITVPIGGRFTLEGETYTVHQYKEPDVEYPSCSKCCFNVYNSEDMCHLTPECRMKYRTDGIEVYFIKD